MNGESRGGALALGLGVFTTVGGLAIAQGGYFATAWGVTSLALLSTVAIRVLGSSHVRFSGLELLALSGLASLLAWTALSALWSLDPAQSILEVQRGLSYIVGLAALLLFLRRRSVCALLAGLVAASTLVSGYSLATRPTGGTVAGAGPRSFYADALSGPIGYSGALGLLAAMGSLLALGFAVRARAGVMRALAAAALVLLMSALTLSASRAAFAALAIGLVVALALGPKRRDVLEATAVALAAPALAAWTSAMEGASSGRTLAATLVLLAAGSAALSWSFVTARDRPATRLATVAIAALLLFGGAAIAVAGRPSDVRSSRVTASRAALDPWRAHESLTARWHLWEVAWRSGRDHPVLGSGAGSFGRSWLELRRTRGHARDAHSLYLETLGELGAVGLALLLVVLGAPLLAATRARRHPLVPAAASAYVAYLVHAGVHWDWEMPVLTLAALSCGAAILVVQRPADGGRAFRAPARSGTLAGVFAVGAFTLIGMVGNAAIARSRAAEAVGAPGEAAAHALAATQWMPWSGEPWRLLGEARMDQGDVALARASFQRGLRKDPRSWKLWKDLSLASGGRAKRDAADRAERLNPMGSR